MDLRTTRLAWIDELARASATLRRGHSPTAAHELRRSALRLDVLLRAHHVRVLRDDLRRLRELAGPVRDLDVLLTRDELHTFAPALRRKRASALRALRRELPPARVRSLVMALTPLALERPRKLERWLERERSALRKALERAARPRPSAKRLHSVRRRARRMLVAATLLGQDLGALRELVQAFGEWRDDTLALEFLQTRGTARTTARRLTAVVRARILDLRSRCRALSLAPEFA